MTTVRSLALDRYRVVAFATHGLVAGQYGVAEPALVLTPPAVATEEDDGLLTASRIAALKLDANWVVLSACNTASGETVGAEGLSGLAKAFFYAGARVLLVSHWSVDSDAAEVLTATAFEELAKDRAIGRAEAIRRAEMALLDGTAAVIDEKRATLDHTRSVSTLMAHPMMWAPFSVVGDGGAGRGWLHQER